MLERTNENGKGIDWRITSRIYLMISESLTDLNNLTSCESVRGVLFAFDWTVQNSDASALGTVNLLPSMSSSTTEKTCK